MYVDPFLSQRFDCSHKLLYAHVEFVFVIKPSNGKIPKSVCETMENYIHASPPPLSSSSILSSLPAQSKFNWNNLTLCKIIQVYKPK